MKKVSLKNIQAIDVHCHPFVAKEQNENNLAFE